MKVCNFIKACIAIIALSAATVGHADVISDASAWSHSGDTSTEVTNPTTDSLRLYYFKGTYFCAGCGNNYWDFSTTATTSGAGSFDFSYNAFNAWFHAGSDLTFFVNGVQQGFFGGYDIHASQTLTFSAGDTILIRAHETNGDSNPSVEGTIVLSNFQGAFAVPEPGSIALMGLGMLGVAVSRRKSRRTKPA